MSTVVWKHPLPNVVNKLDLPAGARVLHFSEQNNGLYLWEAHGTEGTATEARTFQIVGTGDPAEVHPREYVGTAMAMVAGGSRVFHLFETTRWQA